LSHNFRNEHDILETLKDLTFGAGYRTYHRFLIVSQVLQRVGLSINAPSRISTIQLSTNSDHRITLSQDVVLAWANVARGTLNNSKGFVQRAEQLATVYEAKERKCQLPHRCVLFLNIVRMMRSDPRDHVGERGQPDEVTWTLQRLKERLTT
jgi:hypothetical protein